jgi:L-threonylcarbamoyladenylate synthase
MQTIVTTDIHDVVGFLKEGQTVGIPTETVYGLAANAFDNLAVGRIFEVKNRPTFDPLIVHIADVSELHEVARSIPHKAALLAEAFWPGPLTLVLPKQNRIGDLVTSGLDTVGVRCPKHELTRALIRACGFPLAAPSANPFGYISPTKAAHVLKQLGGFIPAVLDGGNCEVGVESTIVQVDTENKATVLRMGGLAVEEIEKVIGKVEVNVASSSKPAAPGMLTSHYAPRKPFRLGNIPELIAQHHSQNFAVLSFCQNYDVAHLRVLSEQGNLAEAAANLFAYLRELDESEAELILAELVPNEGLGRAINDRLKRAAAMG